MESEREMAERHLKELRQEVSLHTRISRLRFQNPLIQSSVLVLYATVIS